MVIQPKIKGFICLTAHPQGCAENVKQQIAYVKSKGAIANGPKKVLIIGASTGYGLASRITATFGAGAQTIGLFFEKPASGKRTASPGWYNSAAFEQEAKAAGIYAKSINGDAFSDEIKQQTIDLIKKDWGGEVDLVIYSLASPKRKDPKSDTVYSSTLKPTGQAFANKTVNVMKGEVSEIQLDPANDDEIAQTVKVMGGEDWTLWMDALLDAGVLADGCTTVNYSYIGPELTFPIYRSGTIGKAKEDMERTAHDIDNKMQAINGHAFVSVNKGLVTQASSAIPVVPLYFSLLYKVMKAKGTHEGCIEQIQRLFAERLFVGGDVPVDDKNRIRIDDLEMQDDIQAEVETLWQQVNTENLAEISDIQGYRDEFHHLFGFGFEAIDYAADVDPDVKIPSLAEAETA